MKALFAVAAALLVVGTAVPSFADITTGSGGAGYLNCYNWCMDHNKTSNSKLQCFHGCDDYWGKHKGISQSTPTSPPPRRPVFDGLAPINPGQGKLQSPPGQNTGIAILHHPTRLR